MAVLLWSGSSPAQANNFSRLAFSITCIPELGYFDFGGIGVGSDNAKSVSKEVKWRIGERDGVYVSTLFYDFGPSERDPDRYVYTNRRSHSLSCDLGGNLIEVTFEPRFLRTDTTATLTVRVDGTLVLDALRFDNSDRNGSAIDGFTFTAGDDHFELDGSAVANPEAWPYQPQYGVTRRFPFRGGDFIPFGGGDFDIVHPLMVEATRELWAEPPAADEVEFYRVVCIPEFGKFFVGTVTLHGEATLRNIERAPGNVAKRYGLFDSRMLDGGREQAIKCDLGDELIVGTLSTVAAGRWHGGGADPEHERPAVGRWSRVAQR